MAAKKTAETVAGTETEKKETVKKEAAPKKTAAKKTTAKSTEEAEAPKKTTAKKTAAKKQEPKGEPEVTVTIQYQNKDIAAGQVLQAAKKAFEEANPDVEIKAIDIYVKPEEGVAYYAVNGQGCEDYKISL